jgi:hypothetical protein
VDELAAGTATIALRDQATIGRVTYREASGYRTLTSSVIFGALQGPGRDALLAEYVNFLLHGSGVEEQPVAAPLAEFRAARSPVRRGRTIGLLLPRTAGATLTVFDATGRRMAGTFVAAGARRADIRAGLPAGAYVARLTGANPASCAFSVVP